MLEWTSGVEHWSLKFLPDTLLSYTFVLKFLLMATAAQKNERAERDRETGCIKIENDILLV